MESSRESHPHSPPVKVAAKRKQDKNAPKLENIKMHKTKSSNLGQTNNKTGANKPKQSTTKPSTYKVNKINSSKASNNLQNSSQRSNLSQSNFAFHGNDNQSQKVLSLHQSVSSYNM